MNESGNSCLLIYLRGCCHEGGARLFVEVPRKTTRNSCHKLEIRGGGGGIYMRIIKETDYSGRLWSLSHWRISVPNGIKP